MRTEAKPDPNSVRLRLEKAASHPQLHGCSQTGVRHKSRLLKVWTKDSSESLGGCFLPAEGNIFHETDVDTAAETVTYGIKSCADNVVLQNGNNCVS